MKNMHESPDRQRADLGGAGIPDMEAMGAKMSAGADCDQIPGAKAPLVPLAIPSRSMDRSGSGNIWLS